MVKVCSYTYPAANQATYQQYYEPYLYELHDFQKWCVEGIVTGNHVLITAPTGTGKTFGGEFALQYFHSKGKKTIYTTPIKALSNEKFHAFTHKYPHINIGLITGDIKTNPDADVIIMTTEILLNKLYQIKSSSNTVLSFDMDIEHDLGCVVFDEIHFINDESRGHIWEQCIMLLPPHIQIVGLSATLDDPERFAAWLETKGEGDTAKTVEKEVYLARKQVRAVPLIHYSFISVPSAVNKVIKDKATQQDIKKFINKPLVIQDEKGSFQDATFQSIQQKLKLFDKHDIRVKRKYILNTLAEYLVENEMLPALCYVFSRKQLEVCAEEITTNLLEFDSKVPYTVDAECEKIIRKLPNYEEYLHLPEYVNTVKLLRKGIGIHHAGSMSVLREMTELLFARGFIKILFCTETMSVGINLPVKTTIFTDIHKFNGSIIRTLHSHEYTQAAGRAGRLGLDKVGHVIHLNNLFRNVDLVSYKAMMNGAPQTLLSKFKISYHLLLNLMDIGDTDFMRFACKSMITSTLEHQMKETASKIAALQKELDTMRSKVQYMRTPEDVLVAFLELQQERNNTFNKKRKELDRTIQSMHEQHKHLAQDSLHYTKIIDKERELADVQNELESLSNYMKTQINKVLGILTEDHFIEGMQLTSRGRIAGQLREVHGLAFARMYEDQTLDCLTSTQLVALFSCFTNIRVLEEYKTNVPNSSDVLLNATIMQAQKLYNGYNNKELQLGIHTGVEYQLQYDLLGYVEQWCECTDVNDCKYLLQTIAEEKQIFLGEFVKALLKINNISSEFEKIAEMTGNVAFLSKLKEIPTITLKYIVTNQSLYV